MYMLNWHCVRPSHNAKNYKVNVQLTFMRGLSNCVISFYILKFLPKSVLAFFIWNIKYHKDKNSEILYDIYRQF